MERFRVQILLLSMLAAAGCGSSGPDRCQDCDVTGLWVGRFQSDLASANGNFFADVSQNGTALTGTFSSNRLDLTNTALAGTQEGGTIVFSESTTNIAFEGVVTEDMTASGDYEVPGMDQGKWWASRAQTGTTQLTDCFDLALEHRPAGLAHDGTDFWVMTSGDVLRLDASGNLLGEFERPGNTAGGEPKLAYIGSSLWYVNSFEIVEMDTAGNELSRHEDPEMEMHLMGIAGVNGDKWVAEYGGDLLQVDAKLNASRTLETPVRNPKGMAWDGSLMWVLAEYILFESELYAVDLSGWVRGYYRLPQGAQSVDLTFDGQSLCVADFEGLNVCRLTISP